MTTTATRTGNETLIFRTTVQPELLAAVFDPIIKSVSRLPRLPLAPTMRRRSGSLVCVCVCTGGRGGATRHPRRTLHVKRTIRTRGVLVLVAPSALSYDHRRTALPVLPVIVTIAL